MTTTEVVEGELLPDVYESTAPLTLFGTSDPTLALERMATMAKLLVDVVKERKLVKKIAGSDYLLAPAWSVLGGMTGLAPYTAWVKPLEDGTGYHARVEVRRVADGTTIAAAEQLCSRSESKWARAEDHALVGMAQTRATSRALRGPLQQIVELAGYQVTPAEEMPVDVEPKPVEPEPDHGKISPGPEHRPSPGQVEELRAMLRELHEFAPNVDWPQIAREAAGVPDFTYVTESMARRVLEELRNHLAELAYSEERAK
jgi:hypothetical protein